MVVIRSPQTSMGIAARGMAGIISELAKLCFFQ